MKERTHDEVRNFLNEIASRHTDWRAGATGSTPLAITLAMTRGRKDRGMAN